MKKVLCILATLLWIVSSYSAEAQTIIPWDGTVAADLSGCQGNGTSESPYLITDASQLAYVAGQILNVKDKDFKGIYFRLENDLDLGGTLETPSVWNPIGGNGKGWAFAGYFDGNNKKIHNIYINKDKTNYIGFFGYLQNTAVVKNLTILNGTIIGGQNVGGISGHSYGSIENCENFANIQGFGSTGITYAGGIVGNNYGKIVNCINKGTVKGLYGVGGIAAVHAKASTYENIIEKSINFGDLYQSSASVSAKMGGIVGECKTNAKVINCCNFGNLYGDGTIGGLIGIISGGTLENSYNKGDIIGTGKRGGVIAEKGKQVTISGLYYDKQMCGVSKAVAGADDDETAKGLFTSEMITDVALSGFNTEVWNFTTNLYPRLKQFETNNALNVNFIPIMLAKTATNYDTRSAVKSNFTLGGALSAVWTVTEGISVTISGTQATVHRPENQDDNVKLKVTSNGFTNQVEIVVYQLPPTVTITQPVGGKIIVKDGATELTSPALVESNTVLTLLYENGDEYLFEYYTIDGNQIEGNRHQVTGNVTISGVFSQLAPPAPWDGTIATEFGGGSGSLASPYLIRTPAQLAYLSQQINNGESYSGKNFKLVYDLDMGNQIPFTPIGKYSGDDGTTLLLGTFDGNGKIIKNLYINATDLRDVGLFGYTGSSSQIKNLGIDENSIIISTGEVSNTGGIIGNSRSYITNCFFKGTIQSSASATGGIVGNAGLEITGCYNIGTITSTGNMTGGIVGSTLVAKVTNCHNTGSISSTNSVGGIIGNGNASDVINCYNAGEIHSISGQLGGIAAMMGGTVRSPKISGCANFGNLINESSNQTGGIVGMCSGSVSDCYNTGIITGNSYLGGIVGRGGMSVSACYNIGDVKSNTSDPLVGGIVGFLDAGGNCVNTYYDKQIIKVEKAVSNLIDTESRKGVLTSFLTKEGGITGFNNTGWIFIEGIYPKLSKINVNDKIILFASPLTLYSQSDDNFETVNNVRNNFTVNTQNGVTWQITEGTTISISENTATVTPKPDQADNVKIKATLGELSKTISLVVPKLAYKLIIGEMQNGTVKVTNSTGEEIKSGSVLTPEEVLTLTAISTQGYHFTKWWDDNTQNPRNITVNGSLNVIAYFEINKYTITAISGNNGEITPEGETILNYGENQTYTILPDEGYLIETLLIDGNPVEIANNCTFNHITANHTIEARFKIKTYKITATASEHGTITPSGETTVNHGENKTFNITPDQGYQIDKLQIDGATVPVSLTHTFNIVVSDHTINVTFKPIVETFEIKIVQAPNGIIEVRDGNTVISDGDLVDAGKVLTLKAIPAEDYILKKWWDGTESNPYTFTVNSDTQITCEFQFHDGIDDPDLKGYQIYSYGKNICINSLETNISGLIEVIDLSGKTLKSIELNAGKQILNIEKTGIYILRITSGDKIKTSKVVLN